MAECKNKLDQMTDKAATTLRIASIAATLPTFIAVCRYYEEMRDLLQDNIAARQLLAQNYYFFVLIGTLCSGIASLADARLAYRWNWDKENRDKLTWWQAFHLTCTRLIVPLAAPAILVWDLNRMYVNSANQAKTLPVLGFLLAAVVEANHTFLMYKTKQPYGLLSFLKKSKDDTVHESAHPAVFNKF